MCLTIAVPTFNRNQILLDNLHHLLPQLTRDCKLLILDNCSAVPVAETLGATLREFPALEVDIRRNRANIGANANILRCFELCDTEWLWVLSDDDTATPDAIEIIFKHIAQYPACMFLNFSSGFFNRERRIVTEGTIGLAEQVDSLGNVLFLSSGVYKADAVVANLRLGYTYAHSQPNFVPLFTSLGDDGVCCLSNEQIVIWNQPSEEQQWSFINFALGIMAFLELPMDPRIRPILANKVLASIPPLEVFALQLLLRAARDNDSRSALYLYDQLRYRLYYFDTDVRRKAKLFLYRLLLHFPRASATALRVLRRRKTSDHRSILQDRFGRI